MEDVRSFQAEVTLRQALRDREKMLARYGCWAVDEVLDGAPTDAMSRLVYWAERIQEVRDLQRGRIQWTA